MNDRDLLKAIAAKDQKAFRLFIEAHQRRIIGLAYKFVNNSQDAEDIAQDVFFKVWKTAHKYRGESTASTWLHRITVNHSLNFLRKSKRESTNAADDYLSGQAAEKTSQPDRQMEMAHNRDMLHRALDELPEKYRTPFILNKLDGMSYKQVAETLKISLSNVEARIHRAKKKLQDILNKMLD